MHITTDNINIVDVELIPGLVSYTEHEINNLRGTPKILVAHNNEDVRKFIAESLSGEIKGKKLLLGKIGEELSQRIYDKTNIYLNRYNIELRSDEIKHTYKVHGDEMKEALRGQQAITADDIAQFSKIVYGFDNVLMAKDNSLHFVKDIGGEVTAVTVYAIGNKSLSLKTMYKKTKNGNSGPATDA
ncbi:MAG: hypothetical protein FWE57_09145 [Chitinispirillia bacterium]|nr:hypothetical protein [Chitinispirillia bacterium]